MNLSKAFAASAIAASFAFAQPAQPVSKSGLNDKVGFGLHGDFEFGNLYGLAEDWNGGDDADAPSGIGFDAGVRGRIPMTSFLQFTPEVNFHYLSLTQSEESMESVFTQMDIEVPLTVRAIVFNYIYVSAGVQASLNVYSDASLEVDNEIDLENGLFFNMEGLMDDYFKVENSTFTLGLVFGVGANIMDRISIDARLVLGVTDLYVERDEDSESWIVLDGLKLLAFKFGVGFWMI